MWVCLEHGGGSSFRITYYCFKWLKVTNPYVYFNFWLKTQLIRHKYLLRVIKDLQHIVLCFQKNLYFQHLNLLNLP